MLFLQHFRGSHDITIYPSVFETDKEHLVIEEITT